MVILPAALAVMAFFHANGENATKMIVHGIAGNLLVLLALTFEWIFLVSALVTYGDWKGSGNSTRVSFPLRILLNDWEDLGS